MFSGKVKITDAAGNGREFVATSEFHTTLEVVAAEVAAAVGA